MLIDTLKAIKRKVYKVKNFFIRFWWYTKRHFIVPVLPKNTDGKVYVNLGSGVHTSKEFINIDTLPFPWVHYISEIQTLPMFKSGTVDFIYASHVAEHIDRSDLSKTIAEWYRVLKPSGVLRLSIPDFDNLIEIYNASGRDVHSIENQLLGQGCPYDDHHTIWNETFAREVLIRVGFKEVRVWDPMTADHHGFGDKSKRTVFMGDREISISLNVEAIK